MNTQQDQQERQMIAEAVDIAKVTRQQILDEIHAGTRELNFAELRQLDMDIRQCEQELRRSA